MKYPKDFCERVMKRFPKNVKVLKFIETNDRKLGGYLQTRSVFKLKASDVIDAFTEGEEYQIYDQARFAWDVELLFKEWSDFKI